MKANLDKESTNTAISVPLLDVPQSASVTVLPEFDVNTFYGKVS